MTGDDGRHLVVEADDDIEGNCTEQWRVHEVVLIHKPQGVCHYIQVDLPQGKVLQGMRTADADPSGPNIRRQA